MTLLFAAALVIAQSATPSPKPSPPVTLTAVVGGYTFATAQSLSHSDLSNALVTIARTEGAFRYSVTAGAYAFPVVGGPLVSAFAPGANVNLFGYVPIAFAQWVPGSQFTLTAGKLATLLGQENGFTFQNINIQRGLAWNAEPTISRGIRATYTPGKLTANLEFNDGYYSGSHRAIEALVGWQSDPNTNVSFAFITPDRNTPPNLTAAVANKAEYDLMIAKQFGKLQILPYLLWINSPASAANNYASTETAFAQAFLANYAFGGNWSIAARFEALQDSSSAADAGANADLIGFGPGSNAVTYTLTPQYKAGSLTTRAEYSLVNAGGVTQNRLGLEIGVQL
jgi:hypothetical protein